MRKGEENRVSFRFGQHLVTPPYRSFFAAAVFALAAAVMIFARFHPRQL